MKRAANLCLVLGIIGFEASLLAAIPEKYQTIVDRNAFGLNPPPPPSTNATEIVPPVKVNVTGFSEFGGEVKAYFVIPAKDIKDQQYLSLGEGQREGILEVVKISKEDGEVRVKNSGVEMVLSLKNNNMSPPPKLGPGVTAVPTMNAPMGAAPGAQAASPVYNPAAANVVANYKPPTPQPAGGPPQPGVQPSGGMPQPGQIGQPMQQPQGNQPELRQIPTRTLRLPPVNNTGTPQSSVAPQAAPGLVFNNNASPVVYSNPDTKVAQNQPISPEEQYLGMHIDAERISRRGFTPPPIPPMPR
jgi:hypothetical protein